MYWLENAVETIDDRITSEKPVYNDRSAEEAYKFGLKCAYDILQNRLCEVTDISFKEYI